MSLRFEQNWTVLLDHLKHWVLTGKKKKQTEISLHLSVWEASQNTRLGCDLTGFNFSTLLILFSRFEYTRQILQFYVIVYAQDFSPGWFV